MPKTLCKAHCYFAAAAGLLTTVADLRNFSPLWPVEDCPLPLLGIVWSAVRNGRFTLRDGPYSDPNHYAMWLLALAPIIWISIPSKTLPARICALAATAFPILTALRTTSRGGFVGMFAMLAIVFFLSSFKMRIVIAGLSAVGLVVMLAFLPASLRSRLAASARIVSSGTNVGPSDEGQIAGDNSAVSRQTLLETGIALTLENPVFGVGPGNFGPTVVEIGKSQGFDWVPLNTHNAYTQISSETGIPGFLLYLVLIVLSVISVVSSASADFSNGATPDAQLHYSPQECWFL